MNSKKENQHFVPKFYLRNFSYEDNGKQIGVFNTKSAVFVERAKLKTQAYKKYYYGKDGQIEDALSQIEGELAKLISEIIQSEKPPPAFSQNHSVLLVFTLLSMLRNPVHERTFNESTDKMIKLAFSKSNEFKDVIKDYEFGFNDAATFGLSILNSLFPIVVDLGYKLLLNETSVPFITSDNPVVKYNMMLERKGAHGGLTGLGSLGLQIFVPVSPNSLVLFYDSASYSIGIAGVDTFRIKDNRVVNDLNVLQFLNCEEVIYFNDEADEEYVRSQFATSKEFEKANTTVVTEHGIIDGAGEVLENQPTIHSRETDCKTNLEIPFIKMTKRAKDYELGNKAAHVRPLTERIMKMSGRS